MLFQKKHLRIFLTLIFLCKASVVQAAGPVTHVYLADMWAQYCEAFNEEDYAAFIRGTLFPDIRYLGDISRAKTHIEALKIEDILNEKNPFEKGRKLHSFIDEEREKFVIEQKIYTAIKEVPGQKYKSTFLKMIEDDMLFREKEWQLSINALKGMSPEETKFGVPSENILKWHRILTHSLQAPPSYHFQQLAIAGKGLFNVPPNVIKEWSTHITLVEKDALVKLYIQALKKKFEVLFKNAKKTY